MAVVIKTIEGLFDKDVPEGYFVQVGENVFPVLEIEHKNLNVYKVRISAKIVTTCDKDHPVFKGRNKVESIKPNVVKKEKSPDSVNPTDDIDNLLS